MWGCWMKRLTIFARILAVKFQGIQQVIPAAECQEFSYPKYRIVSMVVVVMLIITVQLASDRLKEFVIGRIL